MELVVRNLQFYDDNYLRYDVFNDKEVLLLSCDTKQNNIKFVGDKDNIDKIVLSIFAQNDAKKEFYSKLVNLGNHLGLKPSSKIELLNELFKMLNFCYKCIDYADDNNGVCESIVWIYDKEKFNVLIPASTMVAPFDPGFMEYTKLKKENIVLWHNITIAELKELGRNINLYIEG